MPFITQLVFLHSHPLQQWQARLQVILQKSAGSILINKLQANLLMEANFNFGNKLFIGYQMMQAALQLN